MNKRELRIKKLQAQNRKRVKMGRKMIRISKKKYHLILMMEGTTLMQLMMKWMKMNRRSTLKNSFTLEILNVEIS
jgi:hypothetical protein